MKNSPQHRRWTRTVNWPATAARAIAIVVALNCITAQSAHAQTFQVIHTFAGGADGKNPVGGGLTIDKLGNLYGTATSGGSAGNGTVFKLAPKSSGWVFNVLYSFAGGDDGAAPDARVVFGPGGSLFGTTYVGGGGQCYGPPNGCGTVFKLTPPATFCRSVSCPWIETVLYRFSGGHDGAHPAFGDLVFDSAANIYGTTAWGGDYCCYGNVYELTPSSGGWIQTVLRGFIGGNDGGAPWGGVIFDGSRNLYGTTSNGGLYGFGVTFELTPSGGGWTENVLHNFNVNDGDFPSGDLIFDQSGNLYGTTRYFGPSNGGTAYQLSHSADGWTLTVLQAFGGLQYGEQPAAGVIMDGTGNLYGTTSNGGTHLFGSVFKLTPGNGGWTYTSLHDFTGGSDGTAPYCKLVFDANGNLYGTTEYGGSANGYQGYGVVFKITP